MNVLNWAVAKCGGELQGAREDLRCLLEVDQSVICRRLKWPKGLSGTLSRVWPPAATAQAIAALKATVTASNATSSRVRRLLPHLKYVHGSVLAIVCDRQLFERVSNRFLVQVGKMRPRCFVIGKRIVWALCQLLRAEEQFPRMRVPPIIQTLAAFDRVRDKYWSVVDARGVQYIRSMEMVPPPFPEDKDPLFVPLTNGKQVLEEYFTTGPHCLCELLIEEEEDERCAYAIHPDPLGRWGRATMVIRCVPTTNGGPGLDSLRRQHSRRPGAKARII